MWRVLPGFMSKVRTLSALGLIFAIGIAGSTPILRLSNWFFTATFTRLIQSPATTHLGRTDLYMFPSSMRVTCIFIVSYLVMFSSLHVYTHRPLFFTGIKSFTTVSNLSTTGKKSLTTGG
jgi:hypothetical protein